MSACPFAEGVPHASCMESAVESVSEEELCTAFSSKERPMVNSLSDPARVVGVVPCFCMHKSPDQASQLGGDSWRDVVRAGGMEGGSIGGNECIGDLSECGDTIGDGIQAGEAGHAGTLPCGDTKGHRPPHGGHAGMEGGDNGGNDLHNETSELAAVGVGIAGASQGGASEDSKESVGRVGVGGRGLLSACAASQASVIGKTSRGASRGALLACWPSAGSFHKCCSAELEVVGNL